MSSIVEELFLPLITLMSFRAITKNQSLEFHVLNSNNVFGNGMVMHIKVNVTLVPDTGVFAL